MKKISGIFEVESINGKPFINYEHFLAYDKMKDKEIERLKQGYCEIKEKCNKGECDCTNEEYNEMCEKNMKLELEIERLNKENKELNKICARKSHYIDKKDLEITQKDLEIERLKANYERIYNENCKLRENHNINDITLLDENERLNNIINELEEYVIDNSFGSPLHNTTVIELSKVLDKIKKLKENKR